MQEARKIDGVQTKSERVAEHIARLHALVDLGFIGAPPSEQIRRIVEDAAEVLGYDYAEVGFRRSEEDREYVKLCAIGRPLGREVTTIGALGIGLERPRMIFDVAHDAFFGDRQVRALELASVLFWPFGVGGRRCVLVLGWRTPHRSFVTDDEIQYLNLLSTLVSRLLTASESEPASSEQWHETPPAREITIEADTFSKNFLLCYQPIISARTGRVMGAEVLARWLHPERGMLNAAPLLAAARHENQLADFERLTLETAVRKADDFVETIGPMSIHVNVAQPYDELLEVGRPARATIGLEFDERDVARDPDLFVRFMSDCRKRDYRVGLSNFGSGDLSVRTFAQLKLDFVKISAAAMREDALLRLDTEALSTLIEQAHNMGCFVIGETIEASMERRWLTAGGVDALQGFDISSPLTEKDFLDWLRSRR
jgi:EAL domain-containing protein (putative c-di-GMP-specific phosphodiesterase class I)